MPIPGMVRAAAGKRLYREFQRPSVRRAAQWRDVVDARGGEDRDRKLAPHRDKVLFSLDRILWLPRIVSSTGGSIELAALNRGETTCQLHSSKAPEGSARKRKRS